MKKLLSKLVRDERGQDVIEYALLAAGISVVIVPIAPGIGDTLVTVYTDIQAKVDQLL